MKTFVAVLHQSTPATAVDGIIKPMKQGGYQDSGANIAFALQQRGVEVVTPQAHPDPSQDHQWSFPDTEHGIERALSQGARTLWANTVLSASHPLTHFRNQGLWIVGQRPETVQERDDKWSTNRLLFEAGCPVARMAKLSWHSDANGLDVENLSESVLRESGLSFPLVIKPIRGRGSEGVTKTDSLDELRSVGQLCNHRSKCEASI